MVEEEKVLTSYIAGKIFLRPPPPNGFEITPIVTIAGKPAYVNRVEATDTQIIWKYVGIVDPAIHEVVVMIGAVTGKRQGVEAKPGRTTDQNFVFGESH